MLEGSMVLRFGRVAIRERSCVRNLYLEFHRTRKQRLRPQVAEPFPARAQIRRRRLGMEGPSVDLYLERVLSGAEAALAPSLLVRLGTCVALVSDKNGHLDGVGRGVCFFRLENDEVS